MKVHYLFVYTGKQLDTLVYKIRALDSSNITLSNLRFKTLYTASSIENKLNAIMPTLTDIDHIVIIKQSSIMKSHLWSVVERLVKEHDIKARISLLTTNENELEILRESTYDIDTKVI